MGFFSSLNAEAYDREYTDKQLLQRIARYLQAHRQKLGLASAAMLLISVTNAASPVLMGRAVDLLAKSGQGVTDGALASWVVLALFVIGVLVWGLNYLRTRWFSELIADVVFRLRSDALSATLQHDLSFFDEYASGRIISRITSDSQDFGNTLRLVADLMSQIGLMLILGTILLTIEWRMALLVFALIPMVFSFAWSWRKIARNVTRAGFRAMGNVNTAIQEAVTGIAVAKNFRQEAKIYGEFQTVNADSYRINVRRGFVLAATFPILNFLLGIAWAIITFAGGNAVGAGLITVGAWFLFIQAVDSFWFPVINLSAFWTQFQNGLSAAERIFALIDARPVVVQNHPTPAPALQGRIEFQAVHFQYSNKQVVLPSFDLTIQAGESVAFVGHTGAGKSSIAKLISRYYEFQGGNILIDGRDIRSLDLNSYRQQLGIVTQVPFLFAGSVADNIRYANPNATDDVILTVARQIGQGDWLETLPNGLRTAVGERGSRLSMGQRQLVALTRVLVQNPAIFLLDEATASIDPFTETQIQEALRLALHGRTSILIAHRLSTVQAVDRIIVLKQGQMIEQGSHSQLMAYGGHYAELYNTYFRHQTASYRPWETDGG
jgi:ATP-binding cassette subfamily B protein